MFLDEVEVLGLLALAWRVLKELFVFSKSLEDQCGRTALSTRNHMSPNTTSGEQGLRSVVGAVPATSHIGAFMIACTTVGVPDQIYSR